MVFSYGFYNDIHTPTLLLDVRRAQRNIAHMAEKAQRSGVRFRPHFKTHQSAAVGEWFREVGVEAITVSSVEMARYFAAHGWNDILIAFPVNVREIHKINELAQRVHLHLLVENETAVAHLAELLIAPVDVWIEVDAGYRRSGVPWDGDGVVALAQQIARCERMRLRGLLTHDGGTYAARSQGEIVEASIRTAERLTAARRRLQNLGFDGLEISVGDTPACSVLDRFEGVDEIRPGNFIFYDWMQVEIGACTPDEVAVVVACPVVSIHPERNEIILYGGAVHLSKESLLQRNGRLTFGAVVLIEKDGWSAPLPDVWVRSLSQEHGVVYAEDAAFATLVRRIQVGDLLGIVPVHSCLTADLLKVYRTLGGEYLTMAPIPGNTWMAERS
ncbi:alanine racemase [Caldilinea sp.]|jgi:D-serine deaminase-like pyridoxal phosphate-dependent protein|uniref:alanine racemase n=1 Tax=Caldilinea sp. TaxID=2293560 RepID=UPI001B08C48B|nr:alanine racemase [Caldilinea sp.]MBO9394548.1 alanine racemase [Caldilinea sp.]